MTAGTVTCPLLLAERKGLSSGQAGADTKKTKPSEEGSGEKSHPESAAKVSFAH